MCVCVCVYIYLYVCVYIYIYMGFPGASAVKNLSATQKMRVRSLGREDPLEKEMATHFSILAWKTPWTEKTGEATVHRGARVGHELAAKPPPPHIYVSHLLEQIIFYITVSQILHETNLFLKIIHFLSKIHTELIFFFFAKPENPIVLPPSFGRYLLRINHTLVNGAFFIFSCYSAPLEFPYYVFRSFWLSESVSKW